jgi:hypothetical protein
MHRIAAWSIAAAFTSMSSATLVMLVTLLVAIGVVVGWRDPSPGIAVDLPVPGVAGPFVEQLRSVPLVRIDDPRAAAIANGVIFGRTDHVTPADEQAFLASGLWHLLTGRQMDRRVVSWRRSVV